MFSGGNGIGRGVKGNAGNKGWKGKAENKGSGCDGNREEGCGGRGCRVGDKRGGGRDE